MKSFNLLSIGLLANWSFLTQAIDIQKPLQNAPISASTLSLIELHKSLVEHGSVTGDEKNVSSFLVSYLKQQNFTVETQLVTSNPARENILAYSGKSRKTKTLISSHIDTVPPFWPYERRGNEIWGRGSVDAKGSVATQIKAVEALISSSDIGDGDVAMLFVVGEETGGDGMRAANDLGLSWSTVIFGEPTELKLASGHKGALGVKLTAKGKAGHSGYPELGRNANSMLVSALYALEHVKLPSSQKYGNTTLNIGEIGGGVAANVIAEDAHALIQIRIADGTPESITALVTEAVNKAVSGVDIEFTPGYGPVPIDHDIEGECLLYLIHNL